MSRFLNKGSQIFVDILVLSAAYCLAFLFRYEFTLPLQPTKLLFFTLPYVVLFQYLVLTAFRVPRFVWRYVNIRDAQWVVGAIAVSTIVLVALRLGMRPLGGYSRFVLIPLGVLAMDFVLATCGLLGMRALRRILFERKDRKRRQSGDKPLTRTLLIGAGQAGVIVARELSSRPDLGMKAVGFLDDDRLKVGTKVNGVTVLGTVDQVAEIAQQQHIRHALITIANTPGKEIRRIALLCREAGLKTKIIPGIYEIVGGDVNLSRIREVAIEDLLGRAPVNLDDDAVSHAIRDRVVMITGAGGSIGSELCRQVCLFRPSRLVLVERSENALFEIHRELRGKFLSPEGEHDLGHDHKLDIAPTLADICDRERMSEIFERERPDVVFHAAAHKHVPMLEWNPGEAVKNNVLGTRLLADLADAHGVSEFVMISTDKAVNPSSVMGTSKRIAEIYIQSLSQRSQTRFVAVRFGNVLGSAGSVVPIFKQQIARGGPVTVTDPEMQRYFMTIPEASQLVLQAASMGEGGEIFILDMGKPVKIVDLARDLIRLSGLEPDDEIEIVFTGTRPGEKLFEELSVSDERATKTKHPKIFIGHIRPHEWSEVVLGMKRLAAVADSSDPITVKRQLMRLVPEYTCDIAEPEEFEVIEREEAEAV